jgi:hypothetical protein
MEYAKNKVFEWDFSLKILIIFTKRWNIKKYQKCWYMMMNEMWLNIDLIIEMEMDLNDWGNEILCKLVSSFGEIDQKTKNKLIWWWGTILKLFVWVLVLSGLLIFGFLGCDFQPTPNENLKGKS